MPDAETPTTNRPKPRIMGFQIPAELDAAINDAASRLQLSRSSVARLACQRGLSVLLEQLDMEGAQ